MNFDINIVSTGCLFPTFYFAEDSVAVDIVDELTKVIANTPNVKKEARRYGEDSQRSSWCSPEDEIITRVASAFRKYIDYPGYQKADKGRKHKLMKEVAKSIFAIISNKQASIQVDFSRGEGHRLVYSGSDPFWDEYKSFPIAEIKVTYSNIAQSDINEAFESLDKNPAINQYVKLFCSLGL
jgi:hypothetical protein